jgi:hypothetical protein
VSTSLDATSWVWCARCERCYQAGEARTVEGPDGEHRLCAYTDCKGRLYGDTWPYAYLLLEGHPGLPKVPQRGVRYSLAA